MGLFDSIAGQVMGSLTGGAGNGLPNGMVQALMGLVQNTEGGLPGLIASFEGKGLADVVQSWIGTGANLPISAEQIQSVLGGDALSGIASALGVSGGEASGQLAQFLPQIVDKLTPNGQLPEGGDLLGLVKGLLG